MNLTAARGLTSRQVWTHDHITRCYCCGAWTVLTERDVDLIADERYTPPATCKHLNPEQPRREVA